MKETNRTEPKERLDQLISKKTAGPKKGKEGRRGKGARIHLEDGPRQKKTGGYGKKVKTQLLRGIRKRTGKNEGIKRGKGRGEVETVNLP